MFAIPCMALMSWPAILPLAVGVETVATGAFAPAASESADLSDLAQAPAATAAAVNTSRRA